MSKDYLYQHVMGDINWNGWVEITVFTQELSYDEYGNLIEEKRSQNGISTTITNTYNDRDELEKSIHYDGTDSVLYSYNLTGLGNKTETIDYYHGEVDDNNTPYKTEHKGYEYNALNQITSATFSEDGQSTTVNYFYDEYGNLIQEGDGQDTITYEYDLKNQLVSYTEGSETINFRYDGSGNRIEKKIRSNNSVTDTVTYVNDITKPNEEVISLVHNGTTVNYTYGLDRLYEGNEEYLHDSFGNVIEHSSETYEYTPYGDLISGTIDNVNEYGYKGEVHDTDSLQYLRARYYHTSLMQFISEDSYTGEDSNLLSQNRYTFVQNNPYKYSDPSGHIPMFEEPNGTVVTTPPTSTQKQKTPQQPKSEPAKTPSTTTSTYDHVDTTLNEFIHQQKNEDPFYGRINPYEEIEETAGIDPMNAYIHTYKNEHIKRGDPVSSNGDNKVSEEYTEDKVLYASNDLMSSITNPGGRRTIDSSELLSPDESFTNFSRGAVVAGTGIAVGALAFTFAPAIGLGGLAIWAFSGATAGASSNIIGELFDFHTAEYDVDQFLINEGKDNLEEYLKNASIDLAFDTVVAGGISLGMGAIGKYIVPKICPEIFTGVIDDLDDVTIGATNSSDEIIRSFDDIDDSINMIDDIDELKSSRVEVESNSTKRPSWKQSEVDAGTIYPEYEPQQSFINGEQVPYGTKGSSRPDLYKKGASIEVKNYNVETSSGRSNLVSNIAKQYNERIINLPEGTRQSVIIDVRGQNVSIKEMNSIIQKLTEKTNGGLKIKIRVK